MRKCLENFICLYSNPLFNPKIVQIVNSGSQNDYVVRIYLDAHALVLKAELSLYPTRTNCMAVIAAESN